MKGSDRIYFSNSDFKEAYSISLHFPQESILKKFKMTYYRDKEDKCAKFKLYVCRMAMETGNEHLLARLNGDLPGTIILTIDLITSPLNLIDNKEYIYYIRSANNIFPKPYIFNWKENYTLKDFPMWSGLQITYSVDSGIPI